MPKKKTIFESAIRIVRRENFSEPKLEENKLKKMEKASGSVAAPKPDEPQDFYNDKKEHVYTDKEIIGLAEKEIGSLRQQLEDREEIINEFLPYVYADPNHDIWKVVSRAKALIDKQ